MAPSRPWTVNKPGPIKQLAENLWTVDDGVPGLPGATRRMTIIRRADGTLVFFNAIPLPDDALAQLGRMGKPAALVIPNEFHALDAPAFAHRLGLTAFAPVVAVPELSGRMACRAVTELQLDPGMQLYTVEGFKTKEAALVVGDALIVADLVTNAPHGGGVTGLLMRAVGFTGDAPKLPKPVRRRVGEDLPAVKALLVELADRPGLERIIPTHGGVVGTGAAAALRDIAAGL